MMLVPVSKEHLEFISKLGLRKGDIVRALKRLDPGAANVRKGAYGIVIARANYYGDGTGPLVQWLGAGVCNVYPGDVKMHMSRKEWQRRA